MAAGTLAEPLELERGTEVPPTAAGPLSVTVPVAAVPPWIVDGATETVDICTGVMERFA
jgi:hypothetical protein